MPRWRSSSRRRQRLTTAAGRRRSPRSQRPSVPSPRWGRPAPGCPRRQSYWALRRVVCGSYGGRRAWRKRRPKPRRRQRSERRCVRAPFSQMAVPLRGPAHLLSRLRHHLTTSFVCSCAMLLHGPNLGAWPGAIHAEVLPRRCHPTAQPSRRRARATGGGGRDHDAEDCEAALRDGSGRAGVAAGFAAGLARGFGEQKCGLWVGHMQRKDLLRLF